MHDGLIKTALADPPAEGKEIESALSTVDSALAESARTGQRWFDAETHRVRGEILLKRNPADPSPAEAGLSHMSKEIIPEFFVPRR